MFQDGAIKGLNVAQMIRSLSSNTLQGWQEGQEKATDLSQLSASFKIDKGQATTTDLNLVGPLVKMTGVGTIDLGTKMLAFRVEPKLVMTTEGQGRAADPVGLGIPVMIEGSWAEPRIYPEMAGILENPDAAYAKLKEMGKGLFGPGGGLSGLLGGSGSGGTGRQRHRRQFRRRRTVRSARRQARRDPRQSVPAGRGLRRAIRPPGCRTKPPPQHERGARRTGGTGATPRSPGAERAGRRSPGFAGHERRAAAGV